MLQFIKALRKVDHVLLWILSNDTRLLQCSLCAEQRKFQWLAMFCLYTLPLSRLVQAKIQMLTISNCIVESIPCNLVNLKHLYPHKCRNFSPCALRFLSLLCFTSVVVGFQRNLLSLSDCSICSGLNIIELLERPPG